ncbi:MAG: hypothetical protein DWQ10_14390, partial [Calditrichaeota bacterium]
MPPISLHCKNGNTRLSDASELANQCNQKCASYSENRNTARAIRWCKYFRLNWARSIACTFPPAHAV